MTVLTHDEIENLTRILADQALAGSVDLDNKGYFRQLIQRSKLPKRWQATRIGALRGSFEFDALQLITWADSQGTIPDDNSYTTLGALLAETLRDLGGEDLQYVLAVIVARDLFRDAALIGEVQRKYNIPVPAQARPLPGGFDFGMGPELDEEIVEIDWQGPQDAIELQAFLKPEPDFQDVGFLLRAIKRAASVCRIEFDNATRVGTGFIVGKNLVLTNYHVMVQDPYSDENPKENGSHARLLFGKISTETGDEAVGKQFTLDPAQPVVYSSPVNKLDYALLRVKNLALDPDLPVLPLASEVPEMGDDLNILQHPAGQALQLALSGEGIVKVLPIKGLLQYSTRALGGSSGAPGFNRDWRVIALHHAQSVRAFGAIREGILMKNILDEIKPAIA